MKPLCVCKMMLTTAALLICFQAVALAQLFGGATDLEKAFIQKRAAGLGPAHLKMCAEALAKKYPVADAKISGWAPNFVPADYMKVYGWPRENPSINFRYRDSMVIMAPKSESVWFQSWYGAPRCYFAREGGAMRLLAACTSGTQGGICRVPNPIERGTPKPLPSPSPRAPVAQPSNVY